LAVEAKTKTQGPEHYPDMNATKIQNAITILSQMETNLDDLTTQVADLKKKLLNFAEAESEKAKAEVIDQANKEAEDALDQARESAQNEASLIVAKGTSDTNELRAKITGKVSEAVNIIVGSVQSV
jgi:vacuolar-type H+-ATPase subunit H